MRSAANSGANYLVQQTTKHSVFPIFMIDCPILTGLFSFNAQGVKVIQSELLLVFKFNVQCVYLVQDQAVDV